MSKQRKNIIMVIILSLILAIILTAFFVTRKDEPKKDSDNKTVSSDVSSNINVEDIENENDNTESELNKTESELEFLEPDENKADKILEESKKNKNNKNNSSASKPEDTTSKKEPPKDSSSKNQTSKSVSNNSNQSSIVEEKNELETEAEKYLKEHNIDPKTAGETGEQCPHCSKKIWNPDKYGFFIPGMPENYENSDYCLGTCGITFE